MNIKKHKFILSNVFKHVILPKITLPNVQNRFFFDFRDFLIKKNNNLQLYKIKKIIHANSIDMFNTVSDIENYKNFIPYVNESYVKIYDQNNLPSIAGLSVGWKNFNENFDCMIKCIPGKKIVGKSLSLNLFHYLNIEWNFNDINNINYYSSKKKIEKKCEVSLNLEFSFKNSLYNHVSSFFSDQITSLMINAFEKKIKNQI